MEIPSIHPEQERHSKLLNRAGCVSRLDDVAIWFAKRQDKPLPDPLQAAVVLFAADHGVAQAGNGSATITDLIVAAHPDSPIHVLCEQAGASLNIVDVGVAELIADLEGIEHGKIVPASADITETSAMSQVDYWEAVGVGEEMANRAIAEGANLLVASSISHGDAISIAAIACELAGLTPEEALPAHPDANIYAAQLAAVEKTLERAQGTPSHDLLREIGGIELAAMAGFYRAAAQHGVPILLDGLASATAALAAIAWDVRIAGWLLASHASSDGAHRAVLEEMGLEGLMDLNRSLSGGKAAALLIPVLQSSLMLHRGLTEVEF